MPVIGKYKIVVTLLVSDSLPILPSKNSVISY